MRVLFTCYQVQAETLHIVNTTLFLGLASIKLCNLQSRYFGKPITRRLYKHRDFEKSIKKILQKIISGVKILSCQSTKANLVPCMRWHHLSSWSSKQRYDRFNSFAQILFLNLTTCVDLILSCVVSMKSPVFWLWIPHSSDRTPVFGLFVSQL